MAQELAHQIGQAVVSHKGSVVVASATAGSGAAAILDLINGGLGLIAMAAGIVLTTILIFKHLFEFKQMKLQAAKQTGRREEDSE